MCLPTYLANFYQFMNGHKENKYEFYVVKDNWNKTPNGPKTATNFITVDSTIKAITMLYGEENNEEGQGELYLPPGFGDDNPILLDQWFKRDLLSDAHKIQLGLWDPDPTINDCDNHSDTNIEDLDHSLPDLEYAQSTEPEQTNLSTDLPNKKEKKQKK